MRPKIQTVKKEFERRWFRLFLNFHRQGVRGPERAARSLLTGINSRLDGLAELLPLAAQRRLWERAHYTQTWRRTRFCGWQSRGMMREIEAARAMPRSGGENETS